MQRTNCSLNKNISLIVTCEHSGNFIPCHLEYLFKGKKELLRSHQSYDIGAQEFAESFGNKMEVTPFYSKISRLLIDINRSLHHPDLFSKISKKLDATDKKSLIDNYYHPYRNAVESFIRKNISQQISILHLAVHTFTPIWHKIERNVDIGLLYDTSRQKEKNFCIIWQREIEILSPEIKVRRNSPYRGKSDGLTTYFRKIFPESLYIGIEIEINQKYLYGGKDKWNKIQELIMTGLNNVLR